MSLKPKKKSDIKQIAEKMRVKESKMNTRAYGVGNNCSVCNGAGY